MLCTSLIIVIIGNTVLNVALPTLQKPPEAGGLGATNTQVQWIVDAYGLIFAGLLFTAAALGDRFGRKGALQAGLAGVRRRLDARRLRRTVPACSSWPGRSWASARRSSCRRRCRS